MRKREHVEIICVDMERIERMEEISELESEIREKLLATRDRDAHIFWMDIEEGLKTLTKMQRTCFVAHLIEGYGESEIARKLNVSQPVVHRHIEASREKMKKFLIEGGYK